MASSAYGKRHQRTNGAPVPPQRNHTTPKLFDFLLLAHEELLPATRTRIEELLARMDRDEHAELAKELRARLEARLPKKPWWKLWE